MEYRLIPNLLNSILWNIDDQIYCIFSGNVCYMFFCSSEYHKPRHTHLIFSDSVSLLTTQEMSETRGERVGVAGKILLCELINIPFCDLSYDLDVEIFSVAVPLPFGLGTVYLQQ